MSKFVFLKEDTPRQTPEGLYVVKFHGDGGRLYVNCPVCNSPMVVYPLNGTIKNTDGTIIKASIISINFREVPDAKPES